MYMHISRTTSRYVATAGINSSELFCRVTVSSSERVTFVFETFFRLRFRVRHSWREIVLETSPRLALRVRKRGPIPMIGTKSICL